MTASPRSRRSLVARHPGVARRVRCARVVAGRSHPAPDRGDPSRGRGHRRRPTCTAASRPAAGDDEMARLARTMNAMLDRLERRRRTPATLRGRRLPRAAQPAHPHPNRAGGRPRPPGRRRSRRHPSQRPGGGHRPPAPRRRPAPPGPQRRRRRRPPPASSSTSTTSCCARPAPLRDAGVVQIDLTGVSGGAGQR